LYACHTEVLVSNSILMGLLAVSKMYTTNILEFSSHINPTSVHNKHNYPTARHTDEGIQQITGTMLTMGTYNLFF